MRRTAWSAFGALMAGALLLLTGASAKAQEAPTGPLAAIAKRVAARVSTAAAPAKANGKPGAGPAAAKFKPSGTRLSLDDLVNSLGEGEEQRDALRQVLTQGIGALEEALKKEGRANDVSAAFALFVATHWSAATGKEVPDAASDALLAQTDALFDTPEMRQSSDADKQRFYEYCAFLTVFTGVMQEAAEGEQGKKDARAAAAAVFRTLVPADPAKVAITAEQGLVLPDAGDKGEAAGEAGDDAPPAEPGPAPPAAALRMSAPEGWQKESDDAGGAMYSRTVQTSDGGLSVTVAVLAGAARAGAPEVLAGRWFDELIRPRLPEDGPIPRDARAEVFRRYVGNGLRCSFVTASYAKKKDSLEYSGTTQELHLYAVESGGAVVPVLFSLTGHDGMGADGKYINPNVRYEWVEQVLGALSGAPTNKPLFFAAELAGAYELFSATQGPHYYNAITGASLGSGFVSRGNKITLRADGTFEASYAGLSGVGSVDRVYSEKGKGRFKLVTKDQGTLLVMTDSQTGREFNEKVAGAFTLPGDAGKVMVTLPVNMVVTPQNVKQFPDRYLTRPPAK